MSGPAPKWTRANLIALDRSMAATLGHAPTAVQLGQAAAAAAARFWPKNAVDSLHRAAGLKPNKCGRKALPPKPGPEPEPAPAPLTLMLAKEREASRRRIEAREDERLAVYLLNNNDHKRGLWLAPKAIIRHIAGKRWPKMAAAQRERIVGVALRLQRERRRAERHVVAKEWDGHAFTAKTGRAA